MLIKFIFSIIFSGVMYYIYTNRNVFIESTFFIRDEKFRRKGKIKFIDVFSRLLLYLSGLLSLGIFPLSLFILGPTRDIVVEILYCLAFYNLCIFMIANAYVLAFLVFEQGRPKNKSDIVFYGEIHLYAFPIWGASIFLIFRYLSIFLSLIKQLIK